MSRLLSFSALVACALAIGLVATAPASARGGNHCGKVSATDKGGDTAKFKVKAYAVGCGRASKGVKRYYRQTNGEQGKQLTIKGYTCGPMQPYKARKLAFKCRSNHGAKKRYTATWVKRRK